MNEPELTISPADLTYPAAGGSQAPGVGGTYEYTDDRFDEVAGSFLFWGPYLDLDAGVYVVTFAGEVEGRLSVEFIHDSGKMRITQLTLADFAKPSCLVLVRSVSGFEIRGLKTRTLERLRLDAIRLQCIYRGGGAP